MADPCFQTAAVAGWSIDGIAETFVAAAAADAAVGAVAADKRVAAD